MLPTFPRFKPVEWQDRPCVQGYTDRYQPYSDFNFTSIYSWDTRKKMMLSQLNGNLVLLFHDYVTETPFLTFIGSDNVCGTAATLAAYSAKNFQSAQLKLIPEPVALKLDPGLFSVTADEDSFDYIISSMHLSKLGNGTLPSSTNTVRHCKGNISLYPNLEVKVCDEKTVDIPAHLALFKNWAKTKGLDHTGLNEYSAIVRFFANPGISYKMVSIYDSGTLIGFCNYEAVGNNFAVCHFAKAENKYKGIYERLYHEMGKLLQSEGIEYLNFEQDLGLPGLRKSKRKYEPVFYLKKYIVEPKNICP